MCTDGNLYNMVNCRRSRNTERCRNRISVDKLLLVIVMVCASVVHVDSSETDSNEADCSRSKTCKTCANKPECSWSLVQQTCDTSKQIQGGFIVNNKDGCTQFTVMRKWAVANVFNQIAVKISNDTSSFVSYLKKTKITCHLDGLELKGSIINDERIVCEQLRIASSNFPRNAKVLLHDFYVTFDKKRVRFDADADYYFNVYARDCGGGGGGAAAAAAIGRKGRRGGDDCVTCLWNDAADRYYLRKCSVRDSCTGSYELYDRRDADSGTRIPSSDGGQEVRVKCANATIRSFEPRYGLRAGGTAMKIAVRGHGILAENATAVVVTVAGRDCTTGPETLTTDGDDDDDDDDDDDGAAETITCITTGPTVNGTGDNAGPVRVTYVQQSSRKLTVESTETFDFVEPRVTAVSPTCGPVEGGTLLNLTGEYLDASADVRVRVSVGENDNVTCERIAADRDRILCVTGASRGGPAVGAIELLFDSRYAVRSEKFVYAGDPVLDAAQSFDGIASGGTAVPVRGNHFSCIKSAAFCVDSDGVRHCANRGCRVHNDTYMVCLSPELRDAAASSAVRSLRFGLRMNFAGHELDLSPRPDRTTYDVYPDPVYDDFVMSDDGRSVVINGRDSDWNCRADDVTVRILRPQHHHRPPSPQDEPAAADCTVLRTTSNRIVCEVDTSSPDVAAGQNDQIVLRVTVGNALASLVREKPTRNGRDGPESSTEANPVLVAYGTVVVSGSLLFFAIVIVAVVVVAVFRYKRKNHNGDAREYYNACSGGTADSRGTIAELQLLQTGKNAEMIYV